MEILVLNAKSGMDTTSSYYAELSKDAVCAIRQVCLGVKGITPPELAELLRCIADAPLHEQLRGELRDLFNQKLCNDPSVSLHRSTLTKVDFPENYFRQVDWDKLMDSKEDVNCKLVHLAKFWANLGLEHPTEKSAKNIAALAVLTEQDVVIAGPLGVHYLRTFKKQLKEFAVKLRADNMCSQAPEVCTGSVGQLQQSFPQWYSNAYSQDNPPVGCPPHVLLNVKNMQANMGCRSSKTGCDQLGKMKQCNMSKALQMFANMQMQRNQMQVEQPLPGLVLFPRRQPSADDLGQGTQGLPGFLALPPPAATEWPGVPASHTPATTALPLPAPTGTLALPAPPVIQGMPGPQNAVAKHVAALQKILAQGKLTKNDEDSGGEGEACDGELSQPPPKKKKLMKRPAAAVQGKSPSDEPSSSSSLDFPGIGHRPPLIYGKSKVYFPKDSFRLMQQIGDRCDVKFNYKSKDPKEVWKMVAKRLTELNP